MPVSDMLIHRLVVRTPALYTICVSLRASAGGPETRSPGRHQNPAVQSTVCHSSMNDLRNPMLSPKHLRSYQEDGIVFPVTALTPEETAHFRRAFEELKQQAGPPQKYSASIHIVWPWPSRWVRHRGVRSAHTTLPVYE